MTTHYVALIDGKQIGKRSTESRTYTHCVAAKPSYEAAKRQAVEGWDVADADSFEYYSTVARATVGDPKYPGDAYLDKHRIEQRDIDDAKRELGGATTAAEFHQLRAAARLAKIEADKAKGRFDEWGVQTWCGRLDLAHKEAAARRNGSYFAEVRVLEAIVKK
jgi:hypothetical protein